MSNLLATVRLMSGCTHTIQTGSDLRTGDWLQHGDNPEARLLMDYVSLAAEATLIAAIVAFLQACDARIPDGD